MGFVPNTIINQSGSITILNSNTSTSPATAGSAVTIADLKGANVLSFQVTGTYTGGTLSVQYTVDNTNWLTMNATANIYNVFTGAYTSAVTNAGQGIFIVNVAGLLGVRIAANAAMTGTAVVTMRAILQPGVITMGASLPTGGNVIGSINNVGSVTAVNSVIPTVTATALGKAEDAAHASGDTGVMVLGVRNDTPTAAIATTNGDYIPFTTDSLGRVWVNSITANSIDAGHTHFRTTSLVATAQQIKATAGNLYSLNIINTNTTAVYVKIYNILAASVTVGTSPISKTFLVPAGTVGNPGVLRTATDTSPLFFFSTALSVAATGALADTDTTAVTANTVYLEAIYK